MKSLNVTKRSQANHAGPLYLLIWPDPIPMNSVLPMTLLGARSGSAPVQFYVMLNIFFLILNFHTY